MDNFPDRFDAVRQPWLFDSAPRLLNILRAAGGEARFVGGAVRDALLGQVAGEIDLAVTLPPDRVTEALTQAGIKVVPTGIAHGTVTAVLDHKGYEITTLRRDMETDGRRAKVAFTDDWREDAARRDFTFNAIYADAEGRIYDYFDGRQDLAVGNVRFIGDAEMRIREDVLRILRFFRFYAWFGRGAPDAEGLAACNALARLLPQLSAERVGRELFKLLKAPDPSASWGLMQEHGVLDQVAPDAADIARLKALLAVEKKYRVAPSALVRLAALLLQDEQAAARLTGRLKLPNRDTAKLQVLALLPGLLLGKLDPVPLRRALYDWGDEDVRDAGLLLAADSGADIGTALTLIAAWERPRFLISGSDALKVGIGAGPKMGTALKEVEQWWAAKDFRPTREECLTELKRVAAIG